MEKLPEAVPEKERPPPKATEIDQGRQKRLKELGEMLAFSLEKEQLDEQGIKPH